jgi:hypothetical protein
MTFWKKLTHLIPSVRRASERDMQEEVESLREMAGPGALGNLTLAVEDARSELTWISLERLGQDLRYAVRILVKNFSFTVLCVLTLALGIGATSTIVSWINGTLLNAIPGAQRTRDIVSLTRGDLSDSPTPPYSYPDLLDLKRQNTSFVGLLGYHNEPMGLTGNGRPVRVWGTYVTASTTPFGNRSSAVIRRSSDAPSRSIVIPSLSSVWPRKSSKVQCRPSVRICGFRSQWIRSSPATGSAYPIAAHPG